MRGACGCCSSLYLAVAEEEHQNLWPHTCSPGHTHLTKSAHTAESKGYSCSPTCTRTRALKKVLRRARSPQPAAQTSVSSRAVTQPRSATHSPNGAEQHQKSEKNTHKKRQKEKRKENLYLFISVFFHLGFVTRAG